MSIETPVIVPFDVVDANKHFYVEYKGDLSSTLDNRFKFWRLIITNFDTNKQIVFEGSANIYNTNTVDFDEQFNNLFVIQGLSRPMGYWSAVNKNYYFGFPQNFVYNGEAVFENGYHYSIEIDFGVENPIEVTTAPHYFRCCANFTVALESYQYNNDTPIIVTQDTIPFYEIRVTKSFCKLNFSYTQEDGESLKYYQFSLYNNEGVLLGMSKKIYGIPNNGIMYAIENYNNLQHYVLKLYCATQDDRDSTTTIIIHTDYQQEGIYADISFLLDTQNATNNISISVKQLNGEFNGEAEDCCFENDDYITLTGNECVNFIDTYQTISKNFLCRLWCKLPNIKENSPILTIKTTNNNGYIEVFFTGKNFVAYKYSCNITTSYISNSLNETVNNTQDIYFALGYYNGRIEMYTTLI